MRTAANMPSTSAAQRTFDTFELLQTILQFLPPKDIVRGRRVDKTWKAIVDKPSREMKLTLFQCTDSAVEITSKLHKPLTEISSALRISLQRPSSIATPEYARMQYPCTVNTNMFRAPVVINKILLKEEAPTDRDSWLGVPRRNFAYFKKFSFVYSPASLTSPNDKRHEMFISEPPINYLQIRITYREEAGGVAYLIRSQELAIKEGIKYKHVECMFIGFLTTHKGIERKDVEMADVEVFVPSQRIRVPAPK